MRTAELMQALLEELPMHGFHVLLQLISRVALPGGPFTEATVMWQRTGVPVAEETSRQCHSLGCWAGKEVGDFVHEEEVLINCRKISKADWGLAGHTLETVILCHLQGIIYGNMHQNHHIREATATKLHESLEIF